MPVVLDEAQDGSEVVWSVVDDSLPCVRTHEQRRHTKTVAPPVHLKWSNVVVPSTPPGPKEQQGGAVPRSALHEWVEERPNEGLAESGLRMVSWGDVGDGRQGSIAEIAEVGAQRNDMFRKLRIIDESSVAQKRIPEQLGEVPGAVARVDRQIVLVGCVILHVELPGDARLLQRVEDRRGSRVVAMVEREGMPPPRRGGHQVHEVVPRRTLGGTEEPVEQDVSVGEVPVEGKLAIVVVTHGLPSTLVAAVKRSDEAVHPPVVELEPERPE